MGGMSLELTHNPEQDNADINAKLHRFVYQAVHLQDALRGLPQDEITSTEGGLRIFFQPPIGLSLSLYRRDGLSDIAELVGDRTAPKDEEGYIFTPDQPLRVEMVCVTVSSSQDEPQVLLRGKQFSGEQVTFCPDSLHSLSGDFRLEAVTDGTFE